MFGILNPTKLLVTIAIVAAIWYGFKFVSRLSKEKDRDQVPGAKTKAPPKAGKNKAVEDMVACPACGDFVVAGKTVSCGREDCPYPG